MSIFETKEWQNDYGVMNCSGRSPPILRWEGEEWLRFNEHDEALKTAGITEK